MFNEKLYEEAKEKISWISNFIIEYGEKFTALPWKHIDTFKKNLTKLLEQLLRWLVELWLKTLKIDNH